MSSDEIVHGLLAEDDEVREAVKKRLGERALDGSGRPDRAAIGSIVFADRDALAWLEALLHPLVVREYMAWRDELAAQADPPAVCVTEVPLLYEVEGEKRFDVVVVVTAPRDLRSTRTRVPLEAREQRLLPDAEKVARADFAYVNDRGLADLDAFVEGVIRKLEARV